MTVRVLIVRNPEQAKSDDLEQRLSLVRVTNSRKLFFFEDDLSDCDYDMRRLDRNAVIVGTTSA